MGTSARDQDGPPLLSPSPAPAVGSGCSPASAGIGSFRTSIGDGCLARGSPGAFGGLVDGIGSAALRNYSPSSSSAFSPFPSPRGLPLPDILLATGDSASVAMTSPRCGTNGKLSPIQLAKERVFRPVTSQELEEASLPTLLSVCEFPPIVQRSPQRPASCPERPQETHYEYFARRCPGIMPEHRRWMEVRSKTGRGLGQRKRAILSEEHRSSSPGRSGHKSLAPPRCASVGGSRVASPRGGSSPRGGGLGKAKGRPASSRAKVSGKRASTAP